MEAPGKSEVLDYTESLCPVCLQVVDARVVAKEGGVFLKRVCPDHGPSSAYLWPDVDHYRWMSEFYLPAKPPIAMISHQKGCPQDCGLCVSHVRHPTLAEIEVTLRCNLRCPVCFMAAQDVEPDPSLDSIADMYSAIARDSGLQTSIQLTGGEPTIRPDLPEIVDLGRRVGFSAIEINTNGLVLARSPELLHKLVRAGLTGVYLQFDGLKDEVYRQIRNADLLDEKLQAIENCRSAGIQVVLAMTIIDGINTDQIGPTLAFALDNLDVVVGLALQPAFTSGRFELDDRRRIGMGDVVFLLAEQSDGLINPTDLWPLGCSHPLCSCSTLLFHDGSGFQPLTRLITPEDYIDRFDPQSPQGSVFADILSRMVLPGDREGRYGRGLSVVVMNYMDVWNMDLRRLRECSMTVVMPDGRLIPFCAYQVTTLSGDRLYPPLKGSLQKVKSPGNLPRSGEEKW